MNSLIWATRLSETLPYFLFWAFISSPAFQVNQRWSKPVSIGIWFLLSVFVGLRIEIGVDWGNYLGHLDKQIGAPFYEAFTSGEPAYALLNWVSAKFAWDIFPVNFVCGMLFSLGLVSFCRHHPFPWLALSLSFPYLVVAVAMGYSRQGVSIGLLFLALLALERNRIYVFGFWIAIASTFHVSALSMLVLPISTIGRELGRFTGLFKLGLLFVSAFGLYASLTDTLTSYQSVYIDAEYQSQGALVRLVLCLIPAVLFLAYRKSFLVTQLQLSIYTLLSCFVVIAFVALALSPSSTAVDRFALYLIPLQLFVGSYLPTSGIFGLSPVLWRQLLVGLSFIVLFGWIFFSSYSWAWLPYRNLLFEI